MCDKCSPHPEIEPDEIFIGNYHECFGSEECLYAHDGGQHEPIDPRRNWSTVRVGEIAYDREGAVVTEDFARPWVFLYQSVDNIFDYRKEYC